MTKTMDTVWLNAKFMKDVLPADLGKAGINKLTLIDDKYIEIVTPDGSQVRTYYTTTKGIGHFYLNDTRYKIYNIRESLPMRSKNEHQPEKETQQETRKIEVKFPEAPKTPEKPGKIRHAEFDTIKTCIENDIPVYLVGDAGTGKNHTLQDIAEEMGLDFYFTNSIQQEYKITGFIDAGGKFHETEFYQAFTKGGVFFLDEMDASIPEVLVLLNAAIANRYFEFPGMGKVDAHKDFRVVAAGNTVGSGANELYTGRLVLDSATLDRFVVIEFDYDKRVELNLAKGNTDLVNFIRSLRQFCKDNGIRGTFSYRMISSVVKLEAAGLPLAKVIKIAVVKGLDADSIKTLKVTNSGKYYYALEDVKKAI